MNKKKKVPLPSIKEVKKTLRENWALQVKLKDGRKCALCGSTNNLTSHHWYVCDHHAHVARYEISNGITLCYACHIRTVHTRADYVTIKNLYKYMQDNRNFTPELAEYLDSCIDQRFTTAKFRELWDLFRSEYRKFYTKGCEKGNDLDSKQFSKPCFDLCPMNHDKYRLRKTNIKLFLMTVNKDWEFVRNQLVQIDNQIYEITVCSKVEETGFCRYTLEKYQNGK